MTDDLTVFWHNSERTYELFQDLLARSERGAYDDDFLAQLAAYRAAAPDSERADIFAARYLLAQGDAENALLCAERAQEKRPLSPALWSVLADTHSALGNTLEAAVYKIYLHRLAGEDAPDAPPILNNAALMRLTRAMNDCLDAPLAKKRAVIENNVLSFRPLQFLSAMPASGWEPMLTGAFSPIAVI